MIAELFPEFYDVQGQRVLRPGGSQRRRGFRPTLPMGRCLTHPLKHRCSNLLEIRRFLCKCRGADMHADAKRDHWQPPEEFEETRRGDCVDFAIWSWRQLLDIGYSARFVGGKAGKYGEGHAWVTFEKDGKHYLLDPQFCVLGPKMPRVSALRYHPTSSVGWDGEKITYYTHQDIKCQLPFVKAPRLAAEWVWIWGRFWVRFLWLIAVVLARKALGKAWQPPAKPPRP